MNYDERKAILLESIKAAATSVANYAEGQSVQRVIDGIERLQLLGLCLQSEAKTDAIMQEMKAGAVKPWTC